MYYSGLFQYKLAIQVSSTPGISQRTMKVLLQRIRNIVVYTYDILITRATEQEHWNMLDEVICWLKKWDCT